MEKCVVNEGKTYFLDFIFNPNLRTLQQNESVLQLRKKQSDVLALLCAKYPEPVSRADFLAEVWGGGYVTSQSIAQMIRSLRISLGDETKSIIVTIPKLGYQLSAQPYWEEPEQEKEPDKGSFATFSPGNTDVENVSFSTQSIISISPVSATSLSVIPYFAPRKTPAKRTLIQQTLFFSAAVAFFSSLIFVAMTARSIPLHLTTDTKSIYQRSLTELVPHVGNDFMYCCKTNEGVTCAPQMNLLREKCLPMEQMPVDDS